MDILFSPVCFRQADSLYGRETSRLSSGATLSPGSQRLRGLPAAIPGKRVRLDVADERIASL